MSDDSVPGEDSAGEDSRKAKGESKSVPCTSPVQGSEPEKFDSGQADPGQVKDQVEQSFVDEVSELVDQAHAGHADALNELFTRYHQTMVEMARRKLGARLRLKEDPDDLAQTTFREAARDFGSYRYQGEGSLLRWLIQILQNKIRDKAEFYRADKRDFSRERTIDSASDDESHVPKAFRELSSTDLSVTQVVQRDEDFELLRESLTQLSADHRKAISLVFFEGLSLRAAGERMDGRSEDAVRMMLRRAEAKLGDKLKASIGRTPRAETDDDPEPDAGEEPQD